VDKLNHGWHGAFESYPQSPQKQQPVDTAEEAGQKWFSACLATSVI
jgi:hypothetical protein